MPTIPSFLRRLANHSRALGHRQPARPRREHPPIIPIADGRGRPTILHVGMGPLR